MSLLISRSHLKGLKMGPESDAASRQEESVDSWQNFMMPRTYAWIWSKLKLGGGCPYQAACKTGRSKLLSIPFSHFSELGLWAAEHRGLEFDERSYLPLLHVGPLFEARFARGHVNKTSVIVKGSGGYTSVPFLIHPDGSVESDSWSILEATFKIDPQDAKWHSWKTKMDKLGSLMVSVSWSGFVHDGIDHGDVGSERFDETLRWQLTQWKWFVGPLVAQLCKWDVLPMSNLATLEHGRDMLREVCDDVEEVLASQCYLSGDKFGAYDMSFCALTAFALLPPETSGSVAAVKLLDAGKLPLHGVHLGFLNEFRQRKAGQHVLMCYKKHRLGKV